MKTFASRMTAILFAATFALAITIPATAQGAMGGQNGEAMEKLETMSKELQLTPAQKQQVMPILMDEAPKIKALKSDTTLPPMKKAMQMRQIAETTDAKMKPILNPQQYQKLLDMQAAERKQMIEKMQNR